MSLGHWPQPQNVATGIIPVVSIHFIRTRRTWLTPVAATRYKPNTQSMETTGNMSDVAVSCGCGQWPVARVRDTMSEHEGGSARGAEARPLSRT